jgi:hypothetical protein
LTSTHERVEQACAGPGSIHEKEVRKDSAAHVSLSSDPQFQTAFASISLLAQNLSEGRQGPDDRRFRPRPEKTPQYE